MLLYLVAMLRPVAPFVEYIINYDYISKVLCINKDKPALRCNGKCQLMKKLEQQQEDDFNALRIHMEEYPIGFVRVLNFSEKSTNKKIKRKKYFSYNQQYYFSFHAEIFHPPTV